MAKHVAGVLYTFALSSLGSLALPRSLFSVAPMVYIAVQDILRDFQKTTTKRKCNLCFSRRPFEFLVLDLNQEISRR